MILSTVFGLHKKVQFKIFKKLSTQLLRLNFFAQLVSTCYKLVSTSNQLRFNSFQLCFNFDPTSRSKSQVSNLNMFQFVSTFFQLISTSNLKINIFSQVVSTYSQFDDCVPSPFFFAYHTFFCHQINIKMAKKSKIGILIINLSK